MAQPGRLLDRLSNPATAIVLGQTAVPSPALLILHQTVSSAERRGAIHGIVIGAMKDFRAD